MSEPSGLQARLTRRVSPGLQIDADLRVADECLVLFGPSGAGKTSILRLIAGLDRPDRGLVRLDGRDLFDSDRRIHIPLRHRGIGMIFQHHHLFPHLDVAGNVRFGLAHWPRPDAAARAAEVAGLCGITPLLARRVDSLSGGERQRVALARALAPRPRLLLCDEPFSALDLAARSTLVDTLRRVRDAERLPTLYVTHSPAEAVTIGDRLLALSCGRIVADGPPLDVLAARSTAAAAPALDLINALPGVVVGDDPDHLATIVRLDGGPNLLIPRHEHQPGQPVLVLVRAEDLLLASSPANAAGLSARNILPAVVDRLVPHGDESEVVVRTGSVAWISSVVAGAVAALQLAPGRPCALIVKARSCRAFARHDPEPAPFPSPEP